MRIQWSSGAAQEMLNQLERALNGLAECQQNTNLVRNLLDDANSDGENKVIRTVRNKFEAQVEEMRVLQEELEGFIAALQKADNLFKDTEDRIYRLADNTEQAPAWTEQRKNGSGHYINWEKNTYAAMPGMRLNVAKVPSWLETIVEEETVLYFT